MSQFILFTLHEHNKVELTVDFNPMPISRVSSNYDFFNTHASRLLHANISNNLISTIVNFDDICVKAQKRIDRGESIEKTELYSLLFILRNEEVFLWYGNESNNLDDVFTFDELISCTKKSLLEYSGEIYVHYFPESVQNSEIL